jgi:hypothetical protein
MQAHFHLLVGAQSNEAEDPTMALAPEHGQFAEVFVEGHQDSFFREGMIEDFDITWVFGPVTHPVALVAGSGDPISGAAPDARVEEKSQGVASMSSGSTRSCPTTRRA